MNLSQLAQAISAVKGAFMVTPLALDAFRNVNPYGKHAVLDLNDMHAYASIEIVTDLPLERLGRLSLERNNKEIIGIDAAFFSKRDKFKCIPTQLKGVDGAKVTRLVIPFADETMKTLMGIRRGEYVHKAGEQVLIKIAVNGKEENDPQIPVFEASARVMNAQAERFFQQRYTETSLTHSQKGEQKHDFPLMGQNYRLRSMLLECENDDITHIEIRRDNTPIWEKDVESMKYEQLRFGGRKAPSKGVWVDFCLEGWANEQAFTPIAMSTLKLVITKRTAGEINVSMDYIEIERLPTA